MTVKKYTTLDITRKAPGILTVTFNRPDSRNAINSVMMEELRDFWQGMYVDSADTRCVVLTGSGDKAFCAGADLKERNNLDTDKWQKQHAVLEQAMMSMLHCPVPVIAAVNGAAFGGGLELVLASDFAYAADIATFGFPETRLGIIPGAMGTQHFSRACGVRRAKEICFSAESFSAEQALQWGIVNKVCTPQQLLGEVMQAAAKICENAPLAVRQAKKAINAVERMGFEAGYLYEIEAYNRLLPTNDRMEGVNAFNEKRKPKFSGN